MTKTVSRKGLLWYHRFRLFYRIRHAESLPFKIINRLLKPFRNDKHLNLGTFLVPKKVPKKIWIYWSQGWESAPPLAILCRDSWVKSNPDWEVTQLSEDNLSEYLTLDSSVEGKGMTLTGRSNMIRLGLLSKYGGAWVDATAFCSEPLDSWLPYVMQSGFFGFSKPSSTIASWFLAAEEQNKLIRLWENYANSYWKFTQKPERYNWVQFLFEYLIRNDAEARTAWFQTPHISSGGPYFVQQCLKVGKTPHECADAVWSGTAPVYKLNLHIETPEPFLREVRTRLETS